MEAHIQKWDNGRIIIETPKYDLGDMLKDINAKNRHHPALEDEAKGNEAW